MRTSENKKNKIVRIRVTEDMLQHLEVVSSRLGMTVSAYIRKLIENN